MDLGLGEESAAAPVKRSSASSCVSASSRPSTLVRRSSRDLVPVLHNKWNLASADRADMAGQQSKFETSVEDFFSTLDQIELNLKCAAETTGQSQASSRYMLGNLTYHQHISAAKHQVNFTDNIRKRLHSLAEGIVDNSLVAAQQQQQQQQQGQPPPCSPQS